MTRLIGATVLLGTFLLSLASASGDAPSGPRGKDLVLEGLGGVSVCIDQINAELVQAGLSPSQLRAEGGQPLFSRRARHTLGLNRSSLCMCAGAETSEWEKKSGCPLFRF